MSQAVGSKLGRYTLRGLIGEGGAAAVYRAVHDQDGTPHAVKVLRMMSPQRRERLLREGRLQSALDHPNILAVTDVIDTPSAVGLVMPLVEGLSLAQLLARHTLSVPQLDRLAVAILSAAAYAHRNGIIHRDLKPANVLVDLRQPVPVPRVADFGLARALDDQDGLTRTGVAMGTPGYMAPEQIHSARRADTRSDVFSLGAILYTMATGKLPFTGASLGAMLGAIQAGPDPLDAARLGVRAEIILRALSADPDARPADAAALLALWPPPLDSEHWPALGHHIPRVADTPPTTTQMSTMDPLSEQWDEERALVALRDPPGGLPQARSLLAQHDGLEIDAGPGFSAMFSNVSEALAFASACSPPGTAGSAVVHTGTITLGMPSSDAVARGARALEVSGGAVAVLKAAAGLRSPGQVLSTVPGAGLEVLGSWQLAGQPEPLLLHGRPDAALPSDTDRSWQVFWDGQCWQPVRDIPHNLPQLPGAFFGRAAELEAMTSAGSLFQLLGTGGVGKTRLAQHWARRRLGAFPDGVWFCDLSGCKSLEEVLDAIARVLRPGGGGDLAQQLLLALAGRKSLLILDNVEQVAGGIAGLLDAWRGRLGRASLLLTTRERLPGTPAIEVAPLPSDSDAVSLFVDRARLSRPGMPFPGDKLAVVADICARLGGLPLAVELAAARVRVLSLEQIRTRLSERFRLLRGRRSGSRQSTLLATIDWSWAMLTEWEKSALAQCSAFSGAFDIMDAEGVISLDDFPDAPWATDIVEDLVDKSLLRSFLPPGQDTPRFQMYVSIQAYAADRLSRPGAFEGSGPAAAAAAWQRHAAHFARMGSIEALAALHGPDGVEAHRVLGGALDNLRVAAERAIARADTALAPPCALAASTGLMHGGAAARAAQLAQQAAALSGLPDQTRAALLCQASTAWLAQRRYPEVEAPLQAATQLAQPGSQLAGLCLCVAGRLATRRSQMDDSVSHYTQALALGEQLSERMLMTRAHLGLGGAREQQGAPQQAVEHFNAALSLSRETGDLQQEGKALHGLARVDQLQGRTKQAEPRFRRALEISRSVGNVFTESMLHAQLSFLCRVRGAMDEAIEHIVIALRLARAHGDRAREGVYTTTHGALLGDRGDNAEALVVLERALAIHEEVGSPRDRARTLSLIGARHSQMDQLEPALEHYTLALPLLRQSSDRWGEGQLLCDIARTLRRQGHLEEAEQHYLTSLEISQELGFRRYEGLTLNNLGNLLLDRGKVADARRCYTESKKLLHDSGTHQLIPLTISGLAMAAEADGDLGEAAARYGEALTLAEPIGNRLYLGWLRSSMGWLAQRQGLLLQARAHYEAAEQLLRKARAPGYEAVLMSRQALLDTRSGQGDAAAETLHCAETMLETVEVPAERLEVLCNQIALQHLQGLDTTAELAQARTLCTQIGLAPRSLLGQRLTALES